MIDSNEEFRVIPPKDLQDPVADQPEQDDVGQPQVADQDQEVAQASANVTVAATQQLEQQRRYTEEQQQRNFLALRQQQEQHAREFDLMRRENEELRRNMQRQEAPKDELGVAKDAYAEIGHVENIESRALAAQEERYRQAMEKQRAIDSERLFAKTYTDWKEVLSTENLRKLEEQEPEIAATIASNTDNYSAKVAAYKMIQKLGLVEENYNAKRVNERLAQNATRPKAPQTVSSRQGSPALGALASAQPGFAETISDDVAAFHRKQMEEAISRL